jgi:voltage-gated potassium channel
MMLVIRNGVLPSHRVGWRGAIGCAAMRRRNPIQHAMDRFTADPASVRNAVLVMIVITLGIVLVGGLVVWLFDARDFPDLGGALWYTLQTVTTVGYGDKVPTTVVGRLVGALVMVVAVALIAILTAAITSTFVEAAQRRRRAGDAARERDSVDALREQHQEILARLDAIEAALRARDAGPDTPAPAEDRPSR